MFGSRSTRASTRRTQRTTTGTRRGLFGRTRRDPDRVAGGYKAALSNPHTTRTGRKHAKHELKAMGRGRETKVPLMTKIKRTLGIRSSPRRHATTTTTTTTRRTRY